VVYRVGDKVEFKKYGGRSRRSKWVPAEIDKLHRGGMYGELTYNVWLLDSRRIEEYVCGDELRFRYPEDLEKRQRDDEIARCREDLRQINLKLARQQRERSYSRGRRYERQGVWTQRARSADGNVYISDRQNRYEPRSMSVPPAEWPEFLAEFARTAFLGSRGGNQRMPPPEDSDDAHNENTFNAREVPQDEPIYGSERDNYGLRGNMVNESFTENRDYLGDGNRRSGKTDRNDRKNLHGRELNLNVFLRGEPR